MSCTFKRKYAAFLVEEMHCWCAICQLCVPESTVHLNSFVHYGTCATRLAVLPFHVVYDRVYRLSRLFVGNLSVHLVHVCVTMYAHV